MMKLTAPLAAWFLLAASPIAAEILAAEPDLPKSISAFLATHCADCHVGDSAEAGFDIETLATPQTDEEFKTWARVFDRVHDGEMPPPDDVELAPAVSAKFTAEVEPWLRSRQQAAWNREGRVPVRRLTNLQVERSLHDLLGIDIPLAVRLPQEPRTNSFSTVAASQSISHYQLESHLSVVDAALDEAFRRATSNTDVWTKNLSARDISRVRPRSRTREPEMIGDDAVVWSSGLEFYGRLPATTARQAGWYRFTIRASALNRPTDKGVWCTVRSGRGVSSAPLLNWVGAFEAGDKPQEWTFEGWLPEGHMFEVRPGDIELKRARFQGGQVGTGEGAPQKVPGVAIHSVVFERIHQGPDNNAITEMLFGKLPIERKGRNQYQLTSKQPEKDASELLRQFARRAFRRPVADDDLAIYLDQAKSAIAKGEPLLETIRQGYRAILCSPRFLYFSESPGELDDHAIATRLSYLLWGTIPDEELNAAADAGLLKNEDELHRQVDRMLASEKGATFVEDFSTEWFDLDEIDMSEPNRRLYPKFDLVVQHSMIDETVAFVSELLSKDMNVANLIDSDFTFLNSRLARFYQIEGVAGDELRQVKLAADDRRGGVLTHGSVLKITANGSSTSPVIRGVWVSERLLGEEIPPPPKDVPAVEPDIRGAKTVREMLGKHLSDTSCSSCHVIIDPPGYALENYDAAGQWRDKYSMLVGGRRKSGSAIDASFSFANGEPFKDITGFQELVLQQPDVLARNVAEKLLVYGSGSAVAFADRPVLDDIVAKAQKDNYGFRSILKLVVSSHAFRTK